MLPCGYRNVSDRMVILRCCGPDRFYLERVAFPFEFLSFEAPSKAEVEIWTHGLGGPELVETLCSVELVIESPEERKDPEDEGLTGTGAWPLSSQPAQTMTG